MKKKTNIFKQIEKRFQTSMIGCLARVEDYLGFVWGHNKYNPTPQENKNIELWEELRTEILNHCNYQMREALEDLQEHLEYLDRQKDLYEYNFIIKNKKEQ